MLTVLIAYAAALGLAASAGWLLTRRAGSLREVPSGVGKRTDPDDSDTADLGLSRTGPTVVDFSAPWCGPSNRVRHIVNQVCGDLGEFGDVAHIEIDLDANPQAVRQFSVLSLPTTLIFDVGGRQRYRASGVPKAADLRSALTPLLA
jgi:thiol-disulfide isomerase/thioredoxin